MGAEAADSTGKPSSTLFYMSPEQVRGEALDARSNLWSTGAILYEMATDRRAFEGDDLETVQHRILEETPEAPSQVRPKVHPALSQLIMKALAKSPSDRYQSGKELLLDLEACREAPQKPAAKKAAALMQGLNIPGRDPGANPNTAKPATVVPGTPRAAVVPAQPASAVPAPVAKVQGKVVPGSSEPTMLNAAGVEVEATGWKAKAAAASAAAAGTSAADLPKRDPTSQFVSNCIKASVASMEEEAQSAAVTAKPRFNADPMMAEDSKSGGAGSRSFSEVNELPPLKEAMPAGDPQPTAEVEADGVPEPEPAPKIPLRIRAARQEKKKFTLPPMPKVDPKLLLYGIGGAVAVILLFISIVGLYIHFHNTDDDITSAPAASGQSAAAGSAPAQRAATPVPAPTAQPAQGEAPQPEVVTRTFPLAGKHGGRRKGVAPVSTPTIIPGQLAINSTPEGAQIQVDGRSDNTWATPYTLTGLLPGQHTINVSKQGFAPEARTLDITSGGKSFLVVHLAQLGSTVSLGSEPSGASVLVDGKDTGRLTPTQIVLDRGTHTILLRKPGYLEETTTADLLAGQTFHYAPQLRVLGSAQDIKTVNKLKKLFGGNDGQAGMGKVTIKTAPKGAQITVNQRMMDKLSPVEFLANPGNYVIDLTLSGYKPVHRVITVERDGKLILDETMVRE
jgi:serine/threonine-protein kinase